jgi:hypothetical protein
MKMKKFIYYLLTAFTILGFGFYNTTYNASDGGCAADQDILKFVSQKYSETVLSSEIKKKENIIQLEYEYGDDFSENNNKYVIVRVEFTYCDINNHDKVVAMACEEFNFRYNKESNESKCLSTNHWHMCNTTKYNLETFARTKNSSYESGEGFGSTSLTKRGVLSKQIDESYIVFCCDPSGSIIHRIQKS